MFSIDAFIIFLSDTQISWNERSQVTAVTGDGKWRNLKSKLQLSYQLGKTLIKDLTTGETDFQFSWSFAKRMQIHGFVPVKLICLS